MADKPLEGEIVNPPTSVRLTKHPEPIVLMLEAAFHNGYNITEACQYAGISRVTYYEWLADDDGFSYRMSVAQGAVNRKAKEIVIAAINAGDANMALRYLQLRDPDYKPKASLEVDPDSVRVEEKLKEFMDDTNDNAYPAAADDVGTEPTTTTEPNS
jgi:hypothetical protein